MKPLEKRPYFAIVSQTAGSKRSHVVCGVHTRMFVAVFETRGQAKRFMAHLPNGYFRYRIVKVSFKLGGA